MSITINRVLIWGRKVETIVLLATARAMIRLLPFRWQKKTMGDVRVATITVNETVVPFVDPAIYQARQIGRQIFQMSQRMPFRAVCLPQAMTGRWMLARRNQKSQIFIGVRKGENGGTIDLHAWLMTGGQCITGERERHDFVQFQYAKPTDPKPS